MSRKRYTQEPELREAIRHCSQLRGSAGQVVFNSFLYRMIDSNDDIRQILYFYQNFDLLTVDDPQFLFYIRTRYGGNSPEYLVYLIGYGKLAIRDPRSLRAF
jgi:hypothetical protein